MIYRRLGKTGLDQNLRVTTQYACPLHTSIISGDPLITSNANDMTLSPDKQEEIVTEAIDRLSNIKDDPLLGLFSNEPEVIDQVVKSAYEARERNQLM